MTAPATNDVTFTAQYEAIEYGIRYEELEGAALGSMSCGDSIVGNGEPWEPVITVSGDSGFYTIQVSK